MLERLVLAIIPARYGSKSIPNKNLLRIHNMSLTKYAIFSAHHNKHITHIALSSDSTEILSELDGFKGDKFIRIQRPSELSSDSSPDQPMLEHALRLSENLLNLQFEAVVMLQPTSPVRSQNDLSLCIRNVLNTNADSSWTVSEIPIKFHYKKQFTISNNFLEIATSYGHVPRRQDLKNTYYRDGVCYAYKRSVVLTDSLLMGEKCMPVFSEITTNDIDNLEDFENLEKSTLCKNDQLYWKE